ncbi:MAG: hypothetical protein Q4G33_03385 [bacterium]|nr:hypothetical protein [bacterium]
MIKNITVTDENGKILYSTYPKRAKGLVKKGRAKWIGDTAISMLGPSVKEKETKEMANIYEILDNQLSKLQEQLRDAEEQEATAVRIQILKTLEEFKVQEQRTETAKLIGAQLDAMQAALNAEEVTSENTSAREATRQKMLELMEKML